MLDGIVVVRGLDVSGNGMKLSEVCSVIIVYITKLCLYELLALCPVEVCEVHRRFDIRWGCDRSVRRNYLPL
jgi:hypothetical protein